MLSTLGLNQQVSVNKTDKLIREKNLLLREKTAIKEIIRFIASLSTQDDFLSDNGKRIIQWSQKLSQKIENIYFNIGENLSVALWLNLINYRCTGNYIAANGEVDAKELIPEIRRIAKIEVQLMKSSRIQRAAAGYRIGSKSFSYEKKS